MAEFPSEPEIIILTEGEGGERLDKLLFQRYGGHFSRTYFQTLIEKQLVLVNGEAVKKRIKPAPGDEIEVEFICAPEMDLSPEPIPLPVLYEDDHLIAIDKPAGMVTHPAPGHWKGTFVNALLYHCRLEAQEKDTLRPGIVHRLDKDTSGVLIAAKTTQAHVNLVQAFANREVRKEYIAICLGLPCAGIIQAPIGRHPTRRKEMGVTEKGKAAISDVEPLWWNNKYSVVKVKPQTGRTHQIRVHLKYVGHPILGDDLYGNGVINIKEKVKRQLLHACRLQLSHPITGKELDIKADPPMDIKEWIDKIRS
jgi:23S rRNA pseudouridine1911/1915/1917 synthase